MSTVIPKILPILILLGLGFALQKRNYFKEEFISGLKKAIINIFLPALLFVTFVDMKIEKEHLGIFAAILVLLIIFYIVGSLINKIKALYHPMLPFVVTATTFGLLGLSLYETVYGTEQLVKMSVIGVGHEIFIWFIYLTLLRIKLNGEKLHFGLLKGFIQSPLIIAIVAGIGLNLLGLGSAFHDQSILIGIYQSLRYLGNVCTPLILIIVGYGLKLNPKYTKLSLKFIGLRLAVMLTVGYTFKFLILDRILPDDRYFEYAYFTFLILPPPMSLPIFTEQFSGKELGEVMNNTVVFNTIVCIGIFIGYSLLTA